MSQPEEDLSTRDLIPDERAPVDDTAQDGPGRRVEEADVYSLFDNPLHPYTVGLLNSIPRLGEKRERLEVIRGVVPNPLNLPKGCLFKRRCPYAMPICDTPPPLRQVTIVW
jgi:oligopeptide/dipeptide ABC transporter ATP-binding protein